LCGRVSADLRKSERVRKKGDRKKKKRDVDKKKGGIFSRVKSSGPSEGGGDKAGQMVKKGAL